MEQAALTLYGAGVYLCWGGTLPTSLSLLKEGCLPVEEPQAGGMGAAGKARVIFKSPQGIGEDQW